MRDNQVMSSLRRTEVNNKSLGPENKSVSASKLPLNSRTQTQPQ